ncbi:hypothetical protein [Streptomyces sp. NBC_00239]|uniref:hypothetical protein n=1 Tax=Streptomyces sp. NBC_00239 TaxID=2903640 RepID=UPI002E2BE793|nr:hypothetical protein [Streptomyces sp. NBC_00239]
MADFPPSRHSDDDGTDPGRPERGPAPGRPRWVNVFLAVLIALVVAFVIMHLAGGGMGGHT